MKRPANIVAMILLGGTLLSCNDSPSAPVSPPPASPSISPTADAGRTPIPTTATALAVLPARSIRTIVLPADDGGYWFALGLVDADTAFVHYYPTARSPEERARQRARVALLSLADGRLTQVKELDPGDQVGEVAADGRFVAWTELGVMGVKETRWTLTAFDRQTGRLWTVDREPDLDPVRPLYGTFLAVTSGSLVYGRLAEQPSGGTAFQLRRVELATGASFVVASVDGATTLIAGVAADAGKVLWVVRTPSPGVASQARLNLTEVATGQTEVLLPDGSSGRVALQGGVSLASWSSGVWSGHPGLPLARLTQTGSASYVAVADGWAFWVDQGAHRAYGTSLSSGRSVQLADTYTQNVFASGNAVAWVVTPALDTPGTVASSHRLMWTTTAGLP